MTICRVCDERWDLRHDEVEGCPYEDEYVWKNEYDEDRR